MKWIKGFDRRIFIATLKFSSESFTNKCMRFISASGDLGAVWVLLALALLFRESTRQTGWQVFTALFIATVAGEGFLKRVFRRPRPFVTHGPIHLVIPMPKGFSFPSGHTASSFAVATVCGPLGQTAAGLVYLYAGLMALSRVYLKAHYVTDVLIGAVLGTLCGRLTLWLFARFVT